jgi:hypothetical protein
VDHQLMIAEHVTCEMLVELATEWMDGALAPENRVELELHLVTCDGCTAYIEQLRKTREVLGTLEEGPPEPGVRRNLLALFRQHTASDGRGSGEGPEAQVSGDDRPEGRSGGAG